MLQSEGIHERMPTSLGLKDPALSCRGSKAQLPQDDWLADPSASTSLTEHFTLLSAPTPRSHGLPGYSCVWVRKAYSSCPWALLGGVTASGQSAAAKTSPAKQ